MYTQVEGKYTGTKFGKLLSDEGLSANLYYKDGKAYKVFNKGYDKGAVFDEAYAMLKVELMGLPVPKIYQLLWAENHWVIEMDYINGQLMMTRLLDAIHSSDKAGVEREMTTLAQLHYQVHQHKAQHFVDFKEYLKDIISTKEYLTNEQRKELLIYLDKLPKGNMLIHGDFQSFNIIYNSDKPYIIDWATAGAGVPACDVARTYLNYSFPPIPELQQPDLEINERYLWAYQKASGIKFSDIEKWFPVTAALSVGRDPVFSQHMQKYLLA